MVMSKEEFEKEFEMIANYLSYLEVRQAKDYVKNNIRSVNILQLMEAMHYSKGWIEC